MLDLPRLHTYAHMPRKRMAALLSFHLYRFFLFNLSPALSQLHPQQGCQMVYFKTKNPKGIFRRVLEWKMLLYRTYLTAVWYHLRPFGIIYEYMTVWHTHMWSFGIHFRFGMSGPRKIWHPWPTVAGKVRVCAQFSNPIAKIFTGKNNDRWWSQ
jgi:hypothetical protein